MSHVKLKGELSASIFGGLFVLVAICLFLLPGECRAEWITVDNFGGTVTHAGPSQIGLQNARKCVGWTFQSGALERWGLTQKSTISGLTTPITFILPSDANGELLVGVGDDVYRYLIHDDTLLALPSPDPIDAIVTVQGDSTVSRSLISESNWAAYTLSDVQKVRLTRNGSLYEIVGFYSDSVLVLKDTANGGEDSLFLSSAFILKNIYGPPDAAVSNDTVWAVDGITYYRYDTEGDTVFTVAPPAYSDTTTIDSLVRHSDSVFAYGDFDAVGFEYLGWVVIGDDYNQRGIPFEIAEHQFKGEAGERIMLAGDSARWAGQVEGVGWGKGAQAYSIALGILPKKTTLRTVRGRVDTLGRYGRGGEGFYIQMIPFDTTWIASVRQWDCKVVRAKYADTKNYYAKIGRIDGDTLAIIMWLTRFFGDEYLPVPSANTTIEFSIHVPIAATRAGVENESTEYRAIEAHRRRMFFGASTANDGQITWSYASHYDSVNTAGEVLEGNDPVRGVASHGQQMVLFRRRGIEFITGFSTDDFYMQPAPSGVGAASNHCIAKNPLDNSLLFVNESGLWSYSSGTTVRLSTSCQEIFSDSINWIAEKLIWAAVFDNKYWLAAPFGTSTTNNRLVVFDLESQPTKVSFFGGINPSCLYVWREPLYGERMFIGDADSAAVWQVEVSTGSLAWEADWRSGFYDGGDKALRKRVMRYKIDYQLSGVSDFLFVDFYTYKNNKSELVWSDTIFTNIVGVIRMLEIGYDTRLMPVPAKVQGHSISVGVRSNSNLATVYKVALDVITLGSERPKNANP